MENKIYTKNLLVKYFKNDNQYQGNYFVYGEGGMGKSTSMLMLFNSFLDKAINGDNIVPIYIDSKGLDFTYDKPVFEYIIREYCALNKDISNHIEILNDLLRNEDKKYYIIIDAINESESNKYKVIRDIASLKEIFDKNHLGRIIVSSRSDEKVYCFNDFKRIKMLDFTDEQIIAFLNKHDFKNNGESIIKIDIERINPNLLKILRVPMFLKIFKDVYKDANIFPDIYTKNIVRQSDLLEKFVDKIIEDKIDVHKAENSPEYLKCFFALKRFLPALAFEFAKNDVFSISDSALDDLFENKFSENYFKQFQNRRENYFKYAGALDDLLNVCIDDFSFIVCKGENKNVEYSFSHQVWRDYFCADFLVTAMNYDIVSAFEYQFSSNIQQYVGEIIKEYEFENKTDVLSKMSPIEAFMQRNSNVVPPLAIHLCVEIMKKSRNGKITALYDNLDLRYINFYDYNLQGSSFNNAKVYEHNFISQGHTGVITSVSYSPDGKKIISGSTDWTIRIWDANTGKQIGKTLEGHTGGINSVSYSPDGKRIVSGSSDKTIRIWDAETVTQIGECFNGYTSSVGAICYSPDSNRIVSGSCDGTIRIWDSKKGVPIERCLGVLSGAVDDITYSIDGNLIISFIDCGTIIIRDSHSGKQLERIDGYTSAGMSFLGGGKRYYLSEKRIISFDPHEMIHIWDLETHLYTVLGSIIKPNIQKCDFINAVYNSEDITKFYNMLYYSGADVPKEYEPKPIPFEWYDEEVNDKETE